MSKWKIFGALLSDTLDSGGEKTEWVATAEPQLKDALQSLRCDFEYYASSRYRNHSLGLEPRIPKPIRWTEISKLSISNEGSLEMWRHQGKTHVCICLNRHVPEVFLQVLRGLEDSWVLQSEAAREEYFRNFKKRNANRTLFYNQTLDELAGRSFGAERQSFISGFLSSIPFYDKKRYNFQRWVQVLSVQSDFLKGYEAMSYEERFEDLRSRWFN